MVKGRCAESWDHTAAIMALMVNMNRKKGSKLVSAFDLNPYRRKSKSKSKPQIRLNAQDSIKLLKRVFIDHKPLNLKELENGKIAE